MASFLGESSKTYDGYLTYTIGWGLKEYNSSPPLYASRLQLGKLKTIPLKRCNEIMQKFRKISLESQHICAAGLAPEDYGIYGQIWAAPCSGDSGGPLVWSDIGSDTTHLLGVVSWSIKPCGRSTDDPDGDGDHVPIPGTYKRVSEPAALKWIHGCFNNTMFCGDPYSPDY